MSYTTSSGKTETIQVKSVPEPIELTGPWEVVFPAKHEAQESTEFNELTSWSTSSNKDICYFSGTATYKKQFVLDKQLLRPENSLELDLGSVYVIAEVILNGKNLGVLWKAPFRINIDNCVNEGVNSLEVKITNLWPNRLIEDEHLPLDFERKGNGIKKWPEWLLNKTKRPSERVTFNSYKHWDKDAELQPSGLLGPVKIDIFELRRLYK